MTVGSSVTLAQGPEQSEGERTLAHELVHVEQAALGRTGRPASSLPVLEQEARAGAQQLMRGQHVAVHHAAPPDAPLYDDPLALEEYPEDAWVASDEHLLVLATEDEAFLLPGAGRVYVPREDSLRSGSSTRGRMRGDTGPLVTIPATGASGSRFVKIGGRTAIMLDAGETLSGRRVGGTGSSAARRAAVYMDQIQGALAQLGVSRVSQLRLLHVHRDHVNRIPDIVRQFGLRPNQLHVPSEFRGQRGARDPLARAVRELRQSQDTEWQQWRPGSRARNRSPTPGQLIETRYTTGTVVVETVALRSAMERLQSGQNVRAAEVDTASFLTRVTRRTDGAQVVFLGDLRFSDLAEFRRVMGEQRYAEFFRGATTVSGFSHHLGAFRSGDVRGLMQFLDVTLLRTGRLSVLAQTDTQHGRFGGARRATLEFMRQLGIDTTYTEHPTQRQGPSSASASRDRATSQGPASARSQPDVSRTPLAAALQRIHRLNQAAETVRTWRPVLENRGMSRDAVDRLLRQIESSTNTLRERVRPAVEAAARVRAAGGTDYSSAGGTNAQAYQAALRHIPEQTTAERQIGSRGFSTLQRWRRMGAEAVPRRVALERALLRGEYSHQAMAEMLRQLSPEQRRNALYGRRGGPRPRDVAFGRVMQAYSMQMRAQSALSMPSPTRVIPARTRVGAGFMAAIEVGRLGLEGYGTYRMAQATHRRRNVAPFARRLAFWGMFGVRPQVEAVDEGLFSNDHETNYATVIEGLQEGRWDALFFPQTGQRPAISDADALVFATMLLRNVRNYHEFAEAFIDSQQDAVTWESTGRGWSEATWKVKVGRYETSGSNHVVERWEEHPVLTRLMQAFVQRIIANTETLLQERAAGQDVTSDPDRPEGALGGGVSSVERTARLRSPADRTTVTVPGQGRGRSRTVEVDWWHGPPRFFVHDTRTIGSEEVAVISGADYNTYARLRRLTAERGQLVMGGYRGRTWTERYEAGNVSGTVYIPLDALTTQPLPEPAPRPASHAD